MLDRRQALSGLAALVGTGAVSFAGLEPEKFKRVFRYDGHGWREIAWEDMKPGDEVILMEIGESIADKTYLTVDLLTVGKIDGPIQISVAKLQNLTPIYGK